MDTASHSDPRASEDAKAEPVCTSSTGMDADSAQTSVRERYDAVDLRLMDTFPASDAVARYSSAIE